MRLDLGTLAALPALFLLLMCLVSAGILWTQRTYPGFGRWTVGNLLMVLASLLLALRLAAPAWISVLFGNATFLMGAILYLEGARAFRGWTVRLPLVYGGAGLVMLGVVYFYYVFPNLNARVVIASIFLALVYLLASAALLRGNQTDRTVGITFTSSMFGLCGVLLMGRAVYFALWPPFSDMFADTLLNMSFLGGISLTVAGCSVGFIVLTYERLVNELKEAESKSARTNRQLAEALRNSEAQAERAARADTAKSEFVAMMTHEVRNPLGAIIATTELLLETGLTGEQREYGESVNQSAHRLLALTEDALELSRIEAGHLSIESYKFDLHSALADIVRMFAPVAKEKGLDLSLDYAADAPRRFVGDAGRIRQVATNLVGNAVKFTSSGYVRVSVTCEALDPRNAKIQVSVADSGIGIPSERIGSLFEKFGGTSKSTSGKHKGTGIGLAISKRLVEAMGGRIHVDSERGKGSRFVVELRLPITGQ